MYPKLKLSNKNVKATQGPAEKAFKEFCNNVDSSLNNNVAQVRRIESNKLKIHDLTRGKYKDVYDPSINSTYEKQVNEMSNLSSDFLSVFAKPNIDVNKQLINIPIFLVEKSMANDYIAVPGCQCSVRVPDDKLASFEKDGEFDIEEWVESKNPEKEDPQEGVSGNINIMDMLGVYIYSNEQDVIPRRIFIWIDKIQEETKKKSKKKDDINKNAQALFELVLYHELAHALMDVTLYGVQPAPNFSYAKDNPYRFFEEAYADGIALKFMKNCDSFIEDFVNECGKLLYEDEHIEKDTISRWMNIKVFFDYNIAKILGKLINAWESSLEKMNN